MNIDNYYVYVYLDPRKPGNYIYGEYSFDYEPFYIGRGKVNKRKIQRLYDHLVESKKNLDQIKDGNTFKIYKIQNILKENLEPIIFKYKEYLDKESADNLEKDLIKCIGRKHENGPLTNLSNGGDGGVGGWKHMSGKPQSAETKRKKSEATKGIPKSEESKQNMRNYHANNKDTRSYEEKFGEEEALKKKEHLSKINSGENNAFHGRTHSQESLEQMSKAKKGKKMSEEFKVKTSIINTEKWKDSEYRENQIKTRKESWLKRCKKYKILNTLSNKEIIVNGNKGLADYFNVKNFGLVLLEDQTKIYKEIYVISQVFDVKF